MILLVTGVLLLAFLLYAALLLSRLRAETPDEWPSVRLAGGLATLRLHPGWTEEAGPAADAGGPALEVRRIRTGISGGGLVIEVQRGGVSPTPTPAPSTPLEADPELLTRLASLPLRDGVTLDEPVVTPFFAGPSPGARLTSAGSDAEGARGWFEWHLVRGADSTILFRYRCPVLSGSLESLPLARCVESLRFSARPGSPHPDETSGAFRQ